MLYAINSWSYPVAAGLLAASVVIWLRTPEAKGRTAYALVWLGVVLVASIALILPFVLDFEPETRDGTIGVVATRRDFKHWLGDTALIYGILAVAAARPVRASAARRPPPVALGRLGLAAALVFGVLLTAENLTGAAVMAAAMLVGVFAALDRGLSQPARVLVGARRGRCGAAARPGALLPARRVRQQRASSA